MGTVDAVKIPTGRSSSPDKCRSHCAAIVYKVPPANADLTSEGKKTMTIIYSHGNATDIGAMYPLQAILSNSLECNVVSYDYSGYGESGGIAMESNTYTHRRRLRLDVEECLQRRRITDHTVRPIRWKRSVLSLNSQN